MKPPQLVWSARFLGRGAHLPGADVPYRTQLVPLAAIRVALGDQGEVYGVTDKLRQWYWCGVLGELYGGTTESRFARDLGDLVEWVNDGTEPLTVDEAAFNPGRLMTLRTRNSAAYKGIYALLMREDCVDWMYDQSIDLASFFSQSLDIHQDGIGSGGPSGTSAGRPTHFLFTSGLESLECKQHAQGGHAQQGGTMSEHPNIQVARRGYEAFLEETLTP